MGCCDFDFHTASWAFRDHAFEINNQAMGVTGIRNAQAFRYGEFLGYSSSSQQLLELAGEAFGLGAQFAFRSVQAKRQVEHAPGTGRIGHDVIRDRIVLRCRGARAPFRGERRGALQYERVSTIGGTRG